MSTYRDYSRARPSGYYSYADEREERYYRRERGAPSPSPERYAERDRYSSDVLYESIERDPSPANRSYDPPDESRRYRGRAPSPSPGFRGDRFKSRYREPSPNRDYSRSPYSSDVLYESIERDPSPANQSYDPPDESRRYRGRAPSPSPSFQGEDDHFSLPRPPIGSDRRSANKWSNQPTPDRARFGTRPAPFDVYEDDDRCRERSAAPPTKRFWPLSSLHGKTRWIRTQRKSKRDHSFRIFSDSGISRQIFS
ncbi:hypothetical protein NHQ30_006491 [Ciborinia camelliae]|nr:hypothetical protein NHQ30_006491 [Ciborinia camelliae]